MRTRRNAVSLILILAALVAAAFAQTPQPSTPAPSTIPPEQQASKEDVLRMLEVMHVRENTKSMMNTLLDQTKEMTDSVLKRQAANLSPAETEKLKAEINRDTEATMKQLFSDEFINGMIEDTIPVYRRHFSKADVAAVVAFYSSPSGQRFIAEMPVMMGESMQAMQPRLEAQVEKATELAQQQAEDRIKQIQAEKDKASKPAAPAKKPAPATKAPNSTPPAKKS